MIPAASTVEINKLLSASSTAFLGELCGKRLRFVRPCTLFATPDPLSITVARSCYSA